MILPMWLLYAAVMVAGCAATAWVQGSALIAGVLAGAAWNLASLWCLSRMLAAWLGPRRSSRRALGWLLVKFPLLYVLAFVMLRSGSVSLVGFGIGFGAWEIAPFGIRLLRGRAEKIAKGKRG